METILDILFQSPVIDKTFPKSWNLSLLIPIHKSGITTKHENYRGICISNHLSKLFTLILNNKLDKWVEQRHILPDNSLGFRKGLRTEDGLFILTSILGKYAKKGEKVYACFVDFAKFYDTISHDLLFLKLAEKGICGNFYFLLKDMYQNCKYAVKVQLPLENITVGNSKNSSNKTVLFRWYRTTHFKAIAGLKQGCSLSPLLANIYFSDLHDHIKQNHNSPPQLHEKYVTCITGADDLLILSLQREGLQNCINNLNTYTEEWGLQVSLKKTRCVIFSKGHTNLNLQKHFLLGDKIIQFKDYYKYLGVEISDNCEFSKVKKERCAKARSALFMIKQVLSTSGNVSIKLVKKLFESRIEPISTYGSITWGVERSTNTVTLNSLKYDDTVKSIKKFIQTFFSTSWNGYCPQLDLVKRLGRKSDKIIPIFIRFSHLQDKENLLYYIRNLPKGFQLCDNY